MRNRRERRPKKRKDEKKNGLKIVRQQVQEMEGKSRRKLILSTFSLWGLTFDHSSIKTLIFSRQFN